MLKKIRDNQGSPSASKRPSAQTSIPPPNENNKPEVEEGIPRKKKKRKKRKKKRSDGMANTTQQPTHPPQKQRKGRAERAGAKSSRPLPQTLLVSRERRAQSLVLVPHAGVLEEPWSRVLGRKERRALKMVANMLASPSTTGKKPQNAILHNPPRGGGGTNRLLSSSQKARLLIKRDFLDRLRS